jgi:hypothetical protein
MRLNRTYKQDITLWAISSGDDGQGKQNVAAPVQFKGRWEDTQEQFTDRTGQTTVSKAHVFIPAGTSAPIDSWLFLGVSAETDPTTLPNAWQVRAVSNTPDLRNLVTEQVAIL